MRWQTDHTGALSFHKDVCSNRNHNRVKIREDTPCGIHIFQFSVPEFLQDNRVREDASKFSFYYTPGNLTFLQGTFRINILLIYLSIIIHTNQSKKFR